MEATLILGLGRPSESVWARSSSWNFVLQKCLLLSYYTPIPPKVPENFIWGISGPEIKVLTKWRKWGILEK